MLIVWLLYHVVVSSFNEQCNNRNRHRGEGGQISDVKKPTGEVGFLLYGTESLTLTEGETVHI